MSDIDLPGSLAFLSATRAPGKRKVRVANRDELAVQVFMAAGDDDEDDDTDFQADHDENSGSGSEDDDSSDNSDDSNDSSDSDEESDADATTPKSKKPTKPQENDDSNSTSVHDSSGAQNSGMPSPRPQHDDDVHADSNVADMNPVDTITADTRVCCLCLNYNDGEVIQCDCCGLSVHDGCYGMDDDDNSSVSEDSGESTEPWFCEPCLAGFKPSTLNCELCPIKGGALKRIDYGGYWVHLLCALYTPGCSFGDLDRLSPVCIFDAGYSGFGAKSCAGCLKDGNRLAARTGICVKCDAGLCKAYYHIICAQKAGLLVNSLNNSTADTSIEHPAAADPYFFYCPQHSDRHLIQKKARRFGMMENQAANNVERQLTPREKRALEKRRASYKLMVNAKPPSWMPTNQKWQRLLPTSTKFFEKMGRKVEFTEGVSRSDWEAEFRVSFNADMVGKIVMPPAFTSDFITYYKEREKVMPTIRARIQELTNRNNTFKKIQEDLKKKFDNKDKEKKQLEESLHEDHEKISKLCSILKSLGSRTVKPPSPLEFSKSSAPMETSKNGGSKIVATPQNTQPPSKEGSSSKRPLKKRQSQDANTSTSKSSAKKSNAEDTEIDSVRIRRCAECQQSYDQHLLAYCDTCEKHYHIGCLVPPLTKLPKKTSLYGWECSKCFNSRSSSDEDEEADVNAPRRLRQNRKPVVRFNDDRSEDMTPDSPLNGVADSPEAATSAVKRKRPNRPRTRPSGKKSRPDSSRIHLDVFDFDAILDPSVLEAELNDEDLVAFVDSDHKIMARSIVEQRLIDLHMEESVDSVANRVKFGSMKSYRFGGGLEDEDDSNGSMEFTAYNKIPQLRNGTKRSSMPTVKNEDVVIRVEDLD